MLSAPSIVTISPATGTLAPEPPPDFVDQEEVEFQLPDATEKRLAPKELLRPENEIIVINKIVLNSTFNLTDMKCILIFYLIALQRYYGQKN
jgi:hypothetical protein